jgi:hypothetical protein
MSKRNIVVSVALITVLIAYVLCYSLLSRRGMKDAMELGAPGFVYGARGRNGDYNQTFHVACAILFAPINALDRQFFGGMPHLSGGTRGFSNN